MVNRSVPPSICDSIMRAGRDCSLDGFGKGQNLARFMRFDKLRPECQPQRRLCPPRREGTKTRQAKGPSSARISPAECSGTPEGTGSRTLIRIVEVAPRSCRDSPAPPENGLPTYLLRAEPEELRSAASPSEKSRHTGEPADAPMLIRAQMRLPVSSGRAQLIELRNRIARASFALSRRSRVTRGVWRPAPEVTPLGRGSVTGRGRLPHDLRDKREIPDDSRKSATYGRHDSRDCSNVSASSDRIAVLRSGRPRDDLAWVAPASWVTTGGCWPRFSW